MLINWRANAISGSRAVRAAVIVAAYTCVSPPASNAAGDEALARVLDHEIMATELEAFALVARSSLPTELTKAEAES